MSNIQKIKNIKRTIGFALVFLALAHVGRAQSVVETDTIDTRPPVLVHREILMNTTALLDRFLPFGLQRFTGFSDIMFKRYRNDRAFKVGISASLPSGFEGNNRLLLRIGFENRRRLTQRKWSYTRGWELVAGGGNVNIPGFIRDDNGLESSVLGGVLSYGIEYNFNSRVSLMTEAALFAGFRTAPSNGFDDSNGLGLAVIPPLALHIVIKLP